MNVTAFPLPRRSDDTRVFGFSGGTILYFGGGPAVPLERFQAEQLRSLYSTEARAAYRAGKLDESRKAARLWLELTDAVDRLASWPGTPAPSLSVLAMLHASALAELGQ